MALIAYLVSLWGESRFIEFQERINNSLEGDLKEFQCIAASELKFLTPLRFNDPTIRNFGPGNLRDMDLIEGNDLKGERWCSKTRTFK